MRSARLSSLLPSRSETRNRHFGFLQIRNSSKREAPLRVDSLRTGRVGDGREFSGWRRTPVLFPGIKFNPIKCLQSYTLHPQRQGIRASTPDAVQCRHTTYEASRSLRAIPKTTYRQSRIAWPLLLPPPCAAGSRLPGHKQTGLTCARLRPISPRLEYYRLNEVALS
jgi:hypothetical protein